MLNENIKSIRKSKGISQEDLAVRLHVVRQTVSKWEQGLSVPDSEMLIAISEVLEAPVSVLLGETVTDAPKADDIKVLSEKLEEINLLLAERKEKNRKVIHLIFIALCALTVLIFAALALTDNAYLSWDYTDPEVSVVGTVVHAFVWIFFRIAPFVFAGTLAGALLTGKKR